ncbi:response regulator [Ramlibacter henchirensis]|uniref:histidine kinase n=1 Tax=Ramlibacter henchirensis TaxID=204072 RepID=A0A4Z0BQ04_9BURK|nr:ATP-binding protein [Ramlibacter henchirensis]TFZ00921.1 response regulator [Ramlibacter henchirensis]
MKSYLRRLLDRYREHHDMDRPLLQWIGVVGCIAFPLFYAIRLATGSPGWDDLPFRAVAAVLCLGLAVRRWWPATLAPYYIGYSYGVVFYCLSFLLSFSMLKNLGGTPYVVNMVIGAVLIILLADWRNTIVMLVGGYLLAMLALWLTEPAAHIPRDFVFAAAGSVLLVVGGALSHQGQKRVELQRMRRVYSGLAGSVAHEMRSPLAQVRHALDNIAGALTQSQSASGTRLAPEQLRVVLATVQQGRDAVSRGLQAIDLTLQQLQPAPLEPGRVQPVRALACVQQAVQAYAYQDEGQRARVLVEDRGDFVFRGDPTALELVLFNLLKNALYYVPLHPVMAVTITVAADPTPRIVVRDTGPGIAPALLPRLFDEFETAGKAEGTGLGLTFCRRAMRAMGGEIGCRTELGSFTEFTLTFPPMDASAAARASTGPQAVLTGKTLLVVDDQALNRSILRALCLTLDLHVIEAEHGQQVLDLLRGGTVPDAILMDVNMPGLDGLQTTRAMRALPGRAGRVPVVAVTANDSPAVQETASAAGLQAVLAKPVDAAALGRTLSRVLAPLAGELTSSPVPPDSPAALLDAGRIDDFRRMGLLDELVPESLTGMRRLIQELQACAASADAEGVKTALHTLVGLSGEAGAQALHLMLRARYSDLLEGRAPQDTGWIDEARALLASTEEAMLRQYGVAPAAAAQTSSHSLRV